MTKPPIVPPAAVTVVGLGNMGAPMAMRLVGAGFAVEGTRPHASTSKQRSRWRATRWNAGSLIGALAHANEATRSGPTTNNFGKLILKPKTEAEEL